MKIVTIKELWLLDSCTIFHIDTSSRLWVIGVWNIENQTHTHKRTHTHTSGRQLKITFLDVLDYSEYSDTYISKFFFARKQLSQWGSKKLSTFETPITHKRLEISIWNMVRQWSNHNPLIVTIFMTIDARFVILWDFDFFEKRTW